MWLLSLFTAAGQLVNAIELLFKAFPGRGKIKKQTAMSALTQLLDAARKAGLAFNSEDLLARLSKYIDAYVAIQNVAWIFSHAGAVREPSGQVRLDDRGALG